MIKYELFPKIEDVFSNVTDNHKVVFFPLLSIDLESINKGKGKVHFVSYFRDGDPDEILDPNFSYNFMRFKIIGNKYQFDGDFKKINLFEKSVIWYQEAVEIYKNHKEKYLTNSEFVKNEDERRMAIDFEYYYYIQGVLNYWVTRDKYFETNTFIQGGAYTYDYDNHQRDPFEDMGDYEDDGYVDEILEETLEELKISFADLDYIGLVSGYNYLSFGADEVTLFIHKNKKEVLQYYNWS